MRFYLAVCVLLVLSMLVAPVAAVSRNDAVPVKPVADTPTQDDTPNTIAVFSHSDSAVNTIDIREYLVGAVAAEVSPNSHPEALKAQAVACYTYALYVRNIQKKNPDENLGGADISDSSAVHQGYYTKEMRASKWGEKADGYEKKISTAVDAVLGYYLSFSGEPILAVYHAVSAGKTQSADDLWGTPLAYLKSVASPSDKLSPDYHHTVVFSAEEFAKIAESLDGVELPDNESKWIGKTETNGAGYVESVEIGGTKIKGSAVRSAFSLRSSAFTVEYSDSGFTFKTYGYGHGAGMSQHGADYMARQGSNWQEILSHYYSGVEILKVENP